jgi:transposase
MKIQNKRDFRSLSKDTQAELRRLAISKWSKGLRTEDISKLVEVHIETVRKWIRGKKTLEERNFIELTRGRRKNEQKVVTIRQEKRIKDIILHKTPDEVGIRYSLWNRKAIQILIKNKSKQEIVLETVSKYTKRWGLTPQRPNKYAYEQDPKKRELWEKVEFPKIQELAKKEKASIQFEDETGVSLATFYQRTYGLKGNTPKLRLPVTKQSISMISSIAQRGDLNFKLYQGALKSEIFLDFLKKLTSQINQKIFLILDNLRVHKSKVVTEWLSKNEDKIRLFFPTTLLSTTQSS